MTDTIEQEAVTTTLLGVERVSLRTLAGEAWASLVARPGRSALLLLAVAASVAAVTIALGLARTAADESLEAIDELSSTEISIGPGTGPDDEIDPLPIDAAARVRSLVGVVAAGSISDLTDAGIVATVDGDDGAAPAGDDPDGEAVPRPDGTDVVATSAGFFDVIGASVREGRAFDEGHVDRADTVVVLGPDAATELGVLDLTGDPEIVVGDEPHVVIGILGTVERRDDLLDAVFVPESTAAARFGLDAPDRVLLESVVGQAETVTRDALVALGPGSTSYVVDSPAPPADVRDDVADTLDELFAALGVGLAILGALVVVAVIGSRPRARRGEIGLRRAYGARRRHLVGQVLLEALVLALLGAVIGAAVGLVAVVVVAAWAGWSAALGVVYPLVTIGAALLLAVLVAVVATLRETRGEPATAIRSMG